MEQPRADNELVPASDAAKPLFSASQLRVTPHRTAEDIQRDIRDGRFAEMTPGQAGEAGEDSRVLSELRETAAGRPVSDCVEQPASPGHGAQVA